MALSDLDQRPELKDAVVRLFAESGPGRHHAINGEPGRMGLRVEACDVENCLGVLLALASDHVAGALGCCPYSDEQITLWGPVCAKRDDGATADLLLRSLRDALKDSPYESIRVQVDHRNRWLRSFYLRHGLTIWKDNIIFEAPLSITAGFDPVTTDTVEPEPAVTRLGHQQLPRARDLLQQAFPESGHFAVPLAQREREHYRHYGLWERELIVAAAAVRHHARRSWISMIAVSPERRGKGIGQRLVNGIMNHERKSGSRRIGLEVLADNTAAVKAYEHAGLQRAFTSTILTGPI